jgi:hypothetical protein
VNAVATLGTADQIADLEQRFGDLGFPGLDLSSIEPGEARLVPWTAEEYFADTLCTSRSQLDILRVRGPQAYANRHAAGDRSTPAKRLGRLLHMRVLEPQRWASLLAPPRPYLPMGPTRPAHAYGKAKKGTPAKIAFDQWKAEDEAWKAECAELMAEWEGSIGPDSIIMTDGEAAKVEGMATAIEGHDFARGILHEFPDGVNEQAIVWRHPGTGVLIRVLADRLVPYADIRDRPCWFVPDLKTTNDPSEDAFMRSIVKFGYHRQGALYHDAVQALYPGEIVTFVFVAVRNEPDYEAATYHLGIDELACGRRQYENTLRELVSRKESGNWRAGWQNGLRMMTLPSYEYEKP